MPWKKYESHKVVKALPIVDISPFTGALYVGDDHEHFEPSVAAMAEKAEIGGYAVLYPDGYKSVSPKKSFEDGYTEVKE